MNFNNLDKSQTYIGLQYGTSLIAKEIIRFSKIYAPNSKEIPTHVLALVYRLGDWWVFESHSDAYPKYNIPAGVRHFKLKKWFEIEHVNEFKFYPMAFDLEKLEELIGYKYGMGDIRALMNAGLRNNNGKQKDHSGEICSEYLAECHIDKISTEYIQKNIIDFYEDLPAWCITPAHWQNYIDKKKIKQCE